MQPWVHVNEAQALLHPGWAIGKVPTTTCMQHTSRCDSFLFASLVHNSAPFVATQFLYSFATVTALFPRLSELMIQLAPAPACPNMHTNTANSVVTLEVQ